MTTSGPEIDKLAGDIFNSASKYIDQRLRESHAQTSAALEPLASICTTLPARLAELERRLGELERR